MKHLAACLFLGASAVTAGCSSPSLQALSEEPAGAELGPGEICFAPAPATVRLRVEPSFLVLAPGMRRAARVVVDPDFCQPEPVSFSGTDESVVATPGAAEIDYGSPTVELELEGKSPGASTITVSVATGDEDATASAELAVEVIEATPPSCSTGDDLGATELEAGSRIAAGGTLSGASLALPAGADKPNSGSFLWSVPAFDASIGCADDIVPDSHLALGPAVAFGPRDKAFPRDLPFTIPVNPALLPEAARWRHLRVAYSSPAFKEPRTIPVTNPRVTKVDGSWALTFETTRLGTFQAVVPAGAGTVKRARKLTHRAVIGVSMGGAGAAQFGVRHHHLFDVVAALGGPVDWTWLVHHLEQNHLGGFRPIAPGTKLEDIPLEKQSCTTDADCPGSDERCLGVTAQDSGQCTFLTPADEPYEHASTFDNWWYEHPKTGHGGSFDRREYVQIFRDLALMFGNPIGHNPLAPHLPAGVDPTHGSQVGDHQDGECEIWVDPIDGHSNEAKQKELAQQCPVERCSHTQVLKGYYDDEFNPDGTFDVITFCDGSPQNAGLTPWANTWTPSGNGYPMEVAVAVDYNGNGVRDELEPIVRAGHEPWSDWGSDATPSELEPGYGPQNLDPAGDDYDPRFNPTGTEGDHRYQPGEPFLDHGLDGVPNTKDSPYDHGEGDGVFTVSAGLQRFWDYDAHSMVRGFAANLPVPLDDESLGRLDFWTDGGTRDLFNFAVAADHITGTFVARGRAAAYISRFNALPGLDPDKPEEYNPAHVVWEDVQGVIHQRYGKNEPTAEDIESGSGQHVGTANEIAKRVQSALYFIGSRWQDGPKTRVEESAENPADDVPLCEVTGNCTFEFTSSFGRTGPVAVSLPSGYGHKDQQDWRYPVVYMLHGYGMTPEDLGAAIVFLRNWMNGGTDSQYSRLSKAILVYVDGRCRTQKDGEGVDRAECIRGTFFTDSIRTDGPQMDAWWLELMDEIDRRYRTMGPSTIEWTE